MEAYCVIQFKDKQEMALIMNFLTTETEAMYSMTYDLKGFVSDKYDLVFMEKNQMSCDWNGNVELEKKSAPKSINLDKYFNRNPANIINKTDSIKSSIGISAPKMKRKAEIVPLITPKLDDSDDTIRAYQSDDNTQKRYTKKRRYSYHDDTEESQFDNLLFRKKQRKNRKKKPVCIKIVRKDVDQPRKRQRMEVDEEEEKDVTCQMCGAGNMDTFDKQVEHAAMHTNLKRYTCSVEGCDYKSSNRLNCHRHIDNYHADQQIDIKYIQLSREENEQLEVMIDKCFRETDMESGSGADCQVCYQTVDKKGNSTKLKRLHALNHINFMLYKCGKVGCRYETKHESSMKNHGLFKHGKVPILKRCRLELSEEQERKIKNVLIRCFPEFDKNKLSREEIEVQQLFNSLYV